MAIKKLEELKVWQEARKLMRMVYEITEKFPPREKFNLTKHMRQCVRNIPGNIAEGFGRYHFQESMQFYRIARGSLSELKSDIYCSFDVGYIGEDELKRLVDQNEKVGRLLNGLIASTFKLKGEQELH